MKSLLLPLTILLFLISSHVLSQVNVKSVNWLQGNHDEFQTNRLQLLKSTPNFNITLQGSPTIYFDNFLVIADVQRNILLTNYAVYDGEKFPQLMDFGLVKVDLTSGNLIKLNFDTDRPAFSFSAVSHAVMSPQGVYYFALSRQHAGLNFVFSYNLTGGSNNLGYSNYFSIPDGVEVDGLAFVDNTLYVSNAIAIEAYTPDMIMKWRMPTGFTYGPASNLITTQENGKNILYYAVQNTIFRLDTTTTVVSQYQIGNVGAKFISYLGSGNLLVVASNDDSSEDFIYAVNVLNRSTLKLQVNQSELGRIVKCSNSLNIQTSPLSTFSIISCGKHKGTERDKNAIGILLDTTGNPTFSVVWHLPIQANDVRFSATQNDKQILMTNDFGYIVLDIQSGKMISAKKSTIANSSCKVITAINGKFYSVCSSSYNGVVTLASDLI
ncbi:predicted protein [Naegleria gruberi]|uniref:Predicted protein n=1 Tax=Naegleria gruberi TaxID=5762 RepID=D2V3X0_NAEGR|nr:uncharacterized protein NAEGRDRAFT_57045 [Naegleria gruberi]EFC48272.1 predicted protein [Naegleria gruberi]|eukprot:XP_002681016.1 predicted protein [Naegleria gruberi strain NEG-M]